MTQEELNLEISKNEDSIEPLRYELDIVLTSIFPVLMQRLEVARFAEWHRNEDMVKDLADDASVNFFSHVLRKKQMPHDPLAYLVTIAKNLAKTQYKNSRKEPLYVSEPLPDDLKVETGEENDVVREIGFNEVQIEKARIALDSLPKRQRQAFQLRAENPSETDRELGERMGVREDAFRKSVSRARKKLDFILKQNQDDF